MSYHSPDNSFHYGLLEKEDPQVRLGFIRKVYGILSVQLIFTSLCVGGTMVLSEKLLQQLFNPVLMVMVLVMYIFSICALTCCGFDKTVPTNYVLLAIFTGCCSYLVSLTTMRYDPIIVFEAAFLTASITIAITVYAITTKTDFTIFGPVMFIIGFLFAAFGFLSFMFGPEMRLVYACIGVLLFSFYLLMDT